MNNRRCELTYSNSMVGIVIRRALHAVKNTDKRFYYNRQFNWRDVRLSALVALVSEVEI